MIQADLYYSRSIDFNSGTQTATNETSEHLSQVTSHDGPMTEIQKKEKSNRGFFSIFNEKKIKLKDIHQFIADLGHDTDKIKAPDLAYNSLDACCKYRDPAVVMDHQ